MSNKTKAASFQQDYDIVVTARHMSITEAKKQHALDKLSKIDRFHTRIADVTITMDIQRELCRVDIVLKVNNFRVKSHASTSDMYASIDMAVNKIQAQLRKYKTKLASHHAKGLSVVDMAVNIFRSPADDEVLDLNEEIEEENRRQLNHQFQPHEIIKQETRPLKILSHEEAIMKMELSGDLFQIFRHEVDRKIKVIYRCSDGNYGIIEAE